MDLEDKISGCLTGLAVGDAMGSAVKGVKPEAVKQLFKQVDGYLDVKPHLGKGVKRYRMRGLYGAQTQLALAVCDSLLEDKKSGVQGIADRLQVLSQGGSEGEFGVFRRPEGNLVRAVEALRNGVDLLPAEASSRDCNFAVMGIPSALFYKKSSTTLDRFWLESGLMMSRNVWEISAVGVVGLVTLRCLQWEPGQNLENKAEELYQELIEYSETVLTVLQEQFSEVYEEQNTLTRTAFVDMLKGLQKMRSQSQEEILQWVCEHASESTKDPIHHPSQASVLTLIPLALLTVLKNEGAFQPTLTAALNRGRSAEKLGALVGAWMGALCGFSKIPQELKTGLVNGKEIKLRGEALCKRRMQGQSKDLYEMESGSSAKNREEERKYQPVPKVSKPASRSWDDDDDDEFESDIPQKENKAEWRKFQKDKTRKKRDRRKNLDPELELEEDLI
jgi:ADP-ribosyl-[dinitrogen reductase] hydrolase